MTKKITHVARYSGMTGICRACGVTLVDSEAYVAGTGLDARGNSFVATHDLEKPFLFCGILCAEAILGGASVEDPMAIL